VRRQTYSYLHICRTSLPLDWYQIILIGITRQGSVKNLLKDVFAHGRTHWIEFGPFRPKSDIQPVPELKTSNSDVIIIKPLLYSICHVDPNIDSLCIRIRIRLIEYPLRLLTTPLMSQTDRQTHVTHTHTHTHTHRMSRIISLTWSAKN